jgi:pimeloyl-ACP methyl ester carboxylesterase
MKNFFRRPRTWLVLLGLLLLAPLIYSYVLMNEFSWTEKELADYFKEKKMKPDYRVYETRGRKIFYAAIGADTLTPVLFIHGAPGSWYDYVRFFGDTQLISRAQLISPDRPGYGQSGLGQPVTSIREQAALLRPLFDVNRSGKKVILVGHSYGGPIAAQLAMEYPDRVQALMLLAPAMDPDNEKHFAINRLAELKPVQWIMPKMWYSAYFEKKTHEEELRKMGEWNNITAPTYYMFGGKDGIVPPVNVEYAKKKITNAPLTVTEFPEDNHFIPWTQQDSVTKVILRALQLADQD